MKLLAEIPEPTGSRIFIYLLPEIQFQNFAFNKLNTTDIKSKRKFSVDVPAGVMW